MALNLTLTTPENYSRTKLLLRTIPGLVFIYLPHLICISLLFPVSIILNGTSVVSILFFQIIPPPIFTINMNILSWQTRVFASLMHLFEGYPKFFFAKDDNVKFEVLQLKKYSRFHLLMKITFGFLYFTVPHLMVLLVRIPLSLIFTIIAWFSILIAGRYPKRLYNFNLGTLRWSLRFILYQTGSSEMYPKFSSKA